MEFAYLGYAENRKTARGTVSAQSEEAARQILARSGYRVLSLKLAKAFMPSRESLVLSSPRMSPQTIVIFSRQLALLLDSGTDIVTSLELLRAQTGNRQLKRTLGEVVSDLRDGNRLSAALSKHPKVFPQIYIQSLVVGEQSGGLERVLRQAADNMEREAKAAKSTKGALRYPAIVSFVALIMIVVMAVFVFPSFATLYASIGAELPLPTRMALSATSGLRHYGVYLVGGALVLATLVVIYFKTREGRLRRDRLALRLPLIGRVSHLSELARCCRSMSLLLRAGLPLPQIMNLLVQNSGNAVMKKALTDVRQGMLKGEGLSQPMAKSDLFLPMMVQMVGVGEATGNLDTTLLAVAECYEIEAEDRVHSLIGLLQPAITIAIAVVVGFVALSLTSAMYSIYGQMG
ncbi:MAG: type II secretion system F family protein [Chloroflexota bacterium]